MGSAGTGSGGSGGGVDGPLGEVEAALAAYADPERTVTADDVETICALGLHRVDLVGTSVPVPPEVVAAWARLGAWDEVERLVAAAPDGTLTECLLAATGMVLGRGAVDKPLAVPRRIADHVDRIANPAQRASLLATLAEAVAVDDPDGGRALIRQAVDLLDGPDRATESEGSLVALVAALRARASDDPEAAAAADRLEPLVRGPLAQAQVLTTTAAALRDRDPAAARAALASAEQLATTLRDPASRAQALSTVASTLAYQDEAAALDLLGRAEQDGAQVEDPSLRAQILASLVAVRARLLSATADPAQLAAVEEMAERVEVPLLRDQARTDVVVRLAEGAAADPSSAPAVLERAAAVAARIRTAALAGEARVALLTGWVAVAAPAQDAASVSAANELAASLGDAEWRARAFIAVATAAASPMPEAAAEARTRALEAADGVVEPRAQARALAALATVEADVDPDVARRLLERAERVVGHVRSPVVVGDAAARLAMALAFQAFTHPEAVSLAEQLADQIPDPASRDRARASVVSGLLTGTPDPAALERARAIVDRIEDPAARYDALVSLVGATAGVDGGGLAAADRAEALAAEIADPAAHDRALQAIAGAVMGAATTAITLSGPTAAFDLPVPPGLAGMPGLLAPPPDGSPPPDVPDIPGVPAMPDLSDIPGMPDLAALGLPPGALGLAGVQASEAGGADSGAATAFLDRAEELVRKIQDPSHRCTALAGLAASLRLVDPGAAARFLDLAVVTAEEIRTPQLACHALAGVAGQVGPTDPARARNLLDTALTRLDQVEVGLERTIAAGAVAGALAGFAAGDLEVMARLRQVIDDVESVQTRCQVLAQLSTAWAPVEPARATLLLDRAEYEATQVGDPQTRDMALMMIVTSLMGQLTAGPDATSSIERLLASATPATRVKLLNLVRIPLGYSDPAATDRILAQAEQAADAVSEPSERAQALAEVATAQSTRAVAPTDVAALLATDPTGQSSGPPFPSQAWRVLARAAADPGFGHVELLSALISIGGMPAIQAVTDHAREVLAGC